jgi:hypothetical protein
MTDLNPYVSRTPGAASAVGVGGGSTTTSPTSTTPSPTTCACNGRPAPSYDAEDCREFQRIDLFAEFPAVDDAPAGGRDLTIEVDHRGDVFETKSMYLEARKVDGSVHHFAYVRHYEVNEHKLDCISSKGSRGIPVHCYSVPGGCCDGLRVCIGGIESKDEKRALTIHIRVFGKDGGVIQGYLRGRCENCGYEEFCEPRRACVEPG